MLKIEHLEIPQGKRVICISDIHGSLSLLEQLLAKIRYSADDILILLGDFYLKGPQPRETLAFVMALHQQPHVYVVRGNCDWLGEDYLSDREKEWLDNLPHILEAKEFIFVHAAIAPGRLEDQDEHHCMKTDAFMEQGLSFERYVVTGHWPVVNYAHQKPSDNPIVDENSRIIAIDGGCVLKKSGQLNAFIIADGAFSWDFVDSLPVYRVEKAQAAKGGQLNITWLDRFVEKVEESMEGEEFGLYRHVSTGKTITLPHDAVWTDKAGNLCECDCGTDYYLPVEAGDTVSVIYRYRDRIFAKKDGIAGWIAL